MATHEALKMAEEQGLELVEVNPRAAPPVCRIMDFGKFKYESSKKEKESRKHQSTVVVKEIKLRPKTDEHDLDFKIKHVRRFLSEGNKVRLVIAFRGREIVHPETGQAMLDAVLKMVTDIAMIEQRATMEGRRMLLVIGPKGGVIRRETGPTGVPTGPSAGGPSPAGPPGAGAPRPVGAPPPGGPAAGAPRPAAAPAPAAPGAPRPAPAPPAAAPAARPGPGSPVNKPS